jgi:hypothetical protein
VVNPNPRPVRYFLTDDALEETRVRVLHALQANGEGLTRNEIARVARLPIQSVCGRVGELLEEGRIMRGGHRPDTVSGRTNEILIALLPRGQATLEAWT